MSQEKTFAEYNNDGRKAEHAKLKYGAGINAKVIEDFERVMAETYNEEYNVDGTVVTSCDDGRCAIPYSQILHEEAERRGLLKNQEDSTKQTNGFKVAPRIGYKEWDRKKGDYKNVS